MAKARKTTTKKTAVKSRGKKSGAIATEELLSNLNNLDSTQLALVHQLLGTMVEKTQSGGVSANLSPPAPESLPDELEEDYSNLEQPTIRNAARRRSVAPTRRSSGRDGQNRQGGRKGEKQCRREPINLDTDRDNRFLTEMDKYQADIREATEAAKKLKVNDKVQVSPRGLRRSVLVELDCIKCGQVDMVNPDLVYSSRGYVCDNCIGT